MQNDPKNIVGVVRAGPPRYPVRAQRKACIMHGATDVFEVDDQLPLRAIACDWQNGDRVLVQWLWLMAPFRKPIDEKRRAVVAFYDAVQEHGGEIYEIGSHRSTMDKQERTDMLADALGAISKWRPPPGFHKVGRPRRSVDKDAEAYRIWHDHKHYPRYADCEAAWGGKRAWGDWQKAYRLWGKRKN